ncbi:class I SAM-dependent methyltransferase [Streptomyces sp. H39-S7]|uniref:class I SAM-dependent methyltransferase n=1 Tax=Streptomyces sp. H39-S7 TaxID=3004357 RepID=UPI0022AF42EB|nr:class I SAM-dependent methyltransferase [Streptomyces sp. H39-S7]MCZ4123288.1 class I SAM-dependent methyltransferase [Streptomyces sp. H39-S7]
MSVIDLGGTVETWLRAPVRPARVHVVNLEEHPPQSPDWIRAEYGDACDLPKDLLDCGDYDLVYSNSVLEHVGGHAQRNRFADAVHALAPRHWVQTPYRYFPIEPHWLFPGFQILPVNARAQLARYWPLAHSRAGSTEEGLRSVLSTELISRSEMKFYFPDSRVISEHMAGLVKSLIAVKTS